MIGIIVEGASQFSVSVSSAQPNLRNIKVYTIGGETDALGKPRVSAAFAA
jgi:hypothetical protein